jgi:DNA modification methylase/ParB-like chromosome segregation protein Spo0J
VTAIAAAELTPELAASLPQFIDVRPLVPYDRNARTHSPGQVEQIKDAIRQWGFVGAIAFLPPAALKIGHGRREAAMAMWEAGEEIWGPGKRAQFPKWHLPAIDLTGLDDIAVRALVLADNQLALNAGWDETLLREELEALDRLEFELPVIGFDPKELDRLFGNTGGGAGGAGSMAAEFLIPPFSILNAREGWWQDRKREWLALGIRSELGRGENLIKRSLQDRLAIVVPGQYQAAVDFIAECRAKDMTDEQIMDEAARRWGTPKVFEAIPGGAGQNAAYRQGGRKTGLGGVTMDALSSHPRYYEQKTAAERRLGRELTNEEFERDHWVLPDSDLSSGTSIFDPTLCELAIRWFSPVGGTVLDPFAGGSVRGVVAAALGRRYVGVDLRGEQIEANRAQWPGIAERLGPFPPPPNKPRARPKPRPAPEWHTGDSALVVPQLDVLADMIFTCPPYGDLEVYSDDPADISTMDVEDFDRAFALIIGAAVAKLADHRFAVVVVGDYRDKRGLYRNLPAKTIDAFHAAGAALYNEAILVTSVGSLPIRAAKQFRTTRKLGKTHQNVLVFVKGDPRKATAALGPVDVSAALATLGPPADD